MAKPPRWFPAIPIIAIVVSLPLPGFPYLWHKLLHILGAIIFVGNIAVTAAWMTWAVQGNEAQVAAFASTSVNRADLYFTSPGSILLLLNGLTMVGTAWGGLEGLRIGWISAGLTLFIATAVIYVVGVRRYQRQMQQISSKAAEAGGVLPPEFQRAFRSWTVWGLIATVLLLIAVYFMVVKPG